MNAGDPDGLNEILRTVKPGFVASCLRGDFEKQLALHAKAAEYLGKNGGKLFFFSTANVFDNDLSRAHDEGDPPDPKTEYGVFKAECEKMLTAMLCENACILRLPQVWGKDSPRMKALFSALRKDEAIVVYPGLIYNTNTDAMAARQLHAVMDRDLSGIFHLAAEDTVSHRDFYCGLAGRLGFPRAKVKESFEQAGTFALSSKRRGELPAGFRFSNASVIEYLTRR